MTKGLAKSSMASTGAVVTVSLSTVKAEAAALPQALLLEEYSERSHDGSVVLDELTILACKAKEAPHRLRRARYWPVVNGLHLGGIHGHARLQDHVAKVGDGGDPKRTHGALDEEDVLSKRAKYGVEMTKMIHPRLVVDQDIVEEDKYKAAEKGAQYIIHECLKRGRGVAQPERHH
jgi:hypothetical protein